MKMNKELLRIIICSNLDSGINNLTYMDYLIKNHNGVAQAVIFCAGNFMINAKMDYIDWSNTSNEHEIRSFGILDNKYYLRQLKNGKEVNE